MNLKECRDQMKMELDLQEDSWVSDRDLDRFINNAIKYLHRRMVRAHEDYFLTYTTVPLAENQPTLAYPENIFGNKLRSLTFRQNADASNPGARCMFTKVKDLAQIDLQYGGYDNFQCAHRYWLPVDRGCTKAEKHIQLYPSHGMAGFVNIYYIREPEILVQDDDWDDFFTPYDDFIIQKAKCEYLMIDEDPRLPACEKEMRDLLYEIVETLRTQTETKDSNIIQPDFGFYEESL